MAVSYGSDPFLGRRLALRAGLTLIVGLALLASSGAGASDGQTDPLVVREVKVWEAKDFGVSRPGGIAYDSNRELFVVASQGTEGAVVSRVSRHWERVGGRSVPGMNPFTMMFDPAVDVLRWVDDDSVGEVAVAEVAGRVSGDDMPLAAGEFIEPSSAAYNPASRSMWVIDSGAVTVVAPDGAVEEGVDVGPLGDDDLIAFHPADGLLYVLRVGDARLGAVGVGGEVEASYDISSVEMSSPQAMTFAPSTDPTDDPAHHHLFVADSGKSDALGAVMELTLEQPPVLTTRAVEGATLIQSVSAHQWNPPSVDPSGIAWNPNTGRLIVVDSEVNETELWRGVNMWHISRTGRVLATGSTDDGTGEYSNEPTGVGYDPRTNTVFVSDDRGVRSVYVVKPGGDGRFGTADDRVTQIDMGKLVPGTDTIDTEDPAFDPATGHLFVSGGIGREMYRLAPVDGDFSNGATLVASIDLSHLGPMDFEGLTVGSSGESLFVGARTTGEIFEITPQGELIRTIEVDIAANTSIASLGIAPSSNDSSAASLWIADRGDDEVNDGMLFEITVPGLGPAPNAPPSVDTGPDQTVAFPDPVRLSGKVTDDGQPLGSELAVTWSKVSGPGNVTFSNPRTAATTASFTLPGRYVLRLTGADGQLTASDTVIVAVQLPAELHDWFVDDDGHIFEGDINAIATAEITRGCNPPVDDRFCPDDTVTRGQMAAFLVRALGYGDDDGGDHFTDDDASVFEGDIDRLATAGVTRGCNPPDKDRFCPEEELTRGQMAAFLVRALGYSDDGGGDLFVDDNHSVFQGDVDRLATAGITRGCNPPDNDRFCSDEPLTRGQMAAFLARALLYGG